MMTSMDSNGAVSRLPVDGGFGKLHSSHSFSSISSLNHLRLGQHGKAGDVIYRSYGSHAPPHLPPPRYSSLPLLDQPPLLPLPPSMSKHGKKISSAVHTRDQKKKRRPTVSSKREPPGSSTSVATRLYDVSQPKNAAKNKEETIVEEEEEEEEEKAVISPPPSSLPLPSLALIRLRTAVVSRGDRDGGCGGSGAMLQTGGATDELRRLLRL